MKKYVLFFCCLAFCVRGFTNVDTLIKVSTWNSSYNQILFCGEGISCNNTNGEYHILQHEDTVIILTTDFRFFDTDSDFFPGFNNYGEMINFYLKKAEYTAKIEIESGSYGGFERCPPLFSYFESLNFSILGSYDGLMQFVLKDTSFSVGLLKIGINSKQIWDIIGRKPYKNEINTFIFIDLNNEITNIFLHLNNGGGKIYPHYIRRPKYSSVDCIYAEVRNGKIIEIGSGFWEYTNEATGAPFFKRYINSMIYRKIMQGEVSNAENIWL